MTLMEEDSTGFSFPSTENLIGREEYNHWAEGVMIWLQAMNYDSFGNKDGHKPSLPQAPTGKVIKRHDSSYRRKSYLW